MYDLLLDNPKSKPKSLDEYTTHNFIWNIADDVLKDVYVRGKYRHIVLPMTMLRPLDCLLEPTKDKMLERYQQLEEGKFGKKAIAQKKIDDKNITG